MEKEKNYTEEQFGSRASNNFISVRNSFSVKEAMRALIGSAPEKDNIATVFVVDADGAFYGAIELKRLIVARSTDTLDNIIDKDFPFVWGSDEFSEHVERLCEISEELIPVLDDDRTILGVITSGELIDMLDGELGDDYAKLAALSEEEEKDDGLFDSMRKRVPWLIALLFMGLAVSAVVSAFGKVVEALPLVVSFQSLILGMAGNVGTQSLAVTVRSLGYGEAVRTRERWKMIAKETRIALLNGAVLGAVAFAAVCAFMLVFGVGTVGFSLIVSGCVGGAMCFSMMISGFTGAAIPTCLYHFGIDPAVASGPLITTVNDLAAVVSYYGLAWALLLNFAV